MATSGPPYRLDRDVEKDGRGKAGILRLIIDKTEQGEETEGKHRQRLIWIEEIVFDADAREECLFGEVADDQAAVLREQIGGGSRLGSANSTTYRIIYDEIKERCSRVILIILMWEKPFQRSCLATLVEVDDRNDSSKLYGLNSIR